MRKDMHIDAAIKAFREAAVLKADFATPARRDHALHQKMKVAWRSLYSSGSAGREAFREMLADESRYVRLWVASQLLSEGDVEAERVVEVEAKAEGIGGFTAITVLKEWRAGRLRSPFGGG